MLDWSRNPALEEELYARIRHKYVQDRTAEIHFSDTLHCLTKGYWNKVDPIPHDNQALGYFAIGFAMEEVLLRTPPTTSQLMDVVHSRFLEGGDNFFEDVKADFSKLLRVDNPNAYQHEGLWFSPDYFTTAVVGEMDLKTTRMWEDDKVYHDGRPKITTDRPNGFPEGWIKQFMGYAHRLGPTGMIYTGSRCMNNGGHFYEEQHVLECDECGCVTEDEWDSSEAYVDYSVAILYIMPARLVAGSIRFSWDAVELNMAHHLHRASILEDQLAKGEPPTPFMYNEQWECNNCPYLTRCKVTQ